MQDFEKIYTTSANVADRTMSGKEANHMDMKISFPGGKKVDAHYAGFTVKTDQPVAEGGSETAPAPFDLFLVSIGTCTGYYVLSFCQKNKIPTEKMSLTVNIGRNPRTHLVENIHIDIHTPTEFPERYKKAVVKVADACTVKKNLQNPPKIEIKLVFN